MAVQFRHLKKFYPDAEQRIMMAGVRLAETVLGILVEEGIVRLKS